MEGKTLLKIGAVAAGGYLAYQLWVRRNLTSYINYWISGISLDKAKTSANGSVVVNGNMSVQNTGPRGVLLSRISGDLFYQGAHIGTLITKNNLDILPGVITSVPFTFTAPSQKLLSALSQVALKKYKGEPVDFDSTIYFHLPLLGRVPFYNEKLQWK